MLKQSEVPQPEMELVTIESLAPFDHLLRKIDGAVDLLLSPVGQSPPPELLLISMPCFFFTLQC